jgi:hypothetical protein
MSTMIPDPIVAPRRRYGGFVLMLWGAALFVGGIGIGVGSTLLIHRPPPPPPVTAPPPPPGMPDFRPGPIVEQMTRELKLTSDQTKQVTDAYAQRLEAIKSLRSDMVVKLSAQHETLRDAMKKILTEAQFAQWDQNFEAMRSRLMPDAPPWRRPRDDREGPPDGGPPLRGGPLREGPPPDGPGPDGPGPQRLGPRPDAPGGEGGPEQGPPGPR